MNNHPAPSIFNDVIGPVMRGPSSSHCAASLRIGRLGRDLIDGRITHIGIEFDPNGSLATTHKSQGSDMGLFGGLLGWEAYDERLPDSASHLVVAGITVDIAIRDIRAAHPNTYKLTLSNGEEQRRMTAISTGGGMIEVISIDGAQVSMAGDYCETLIYYKTAGPREVFEASLVAYIEKVFPCDAILVHHGDMDFIGLKAQTFPDQHFCKELLVLEEILFIRKLSPVLPVLSGAGREVPFITSTAMTAYNEGKGLSLWELAMHYEGARGNISHRQVFDKMLQIVRIMQASVQTGLKGTHYPDRLLGPQSLAFKEKMDKGSLVEGLLLNRIILFVSAIMEVKSSMGVIVAAPTAGSCGALPGAILAVATTMGLSETQTVHAMLGAGLIGVFIAAHATFAAEVGGCQAECGSGSGMAAAAIVYLAGGSVAQSLCAASLALQNSLGMICDPIANRVEAPCLGKNIMAATNALSCANMALAGYDHLIPLDEVIDTMATVGHSIPSALRCTNLGGLSITSAAKALEQRLEKQQFFKSC